MYMLFIFLLNTPTPWLHDLVAAAQWSRSMATQKEDRGGALLEMRSGGTACPEMAEGRALPHMREGRGDARRATVMPGVGACW